MRRILQAISWTALAITIVPSILYLSGHVDLTQTKTAMLVATIVWFVATPLWMGREPEEAT